VTLLSNLRFISCVTHWQDYAAAWVSAVWRGLHAFLAQRLGGSLDAPLRLALHAALQAVARADLLRSQAAFEQAQQAQQGQQGQPQGSDGGVSRAELRGELVQHIGDLLTDDMMFARFVAKVQADYEQALSQVLDAEARLAALQDHLNLQQQQQQGGQSNEAEAAALEQWQAQQIQLLELRLADAVSRRDHDLRMLRRHRYVHAFFSSMSVIS
jgi:hypothetical protein